MKKILILFLVLSLLGLLAGCQVSPVPLEDDLEGQENINKNEDSANDPTDKVKYTVDNDGGFFSENDLIYFIMTDRFNDGDASNNNFNDVDKEDPLQFHGGDFKGITEKLDYIKSLGATAIWLTPVVKNEPNGYHGYWTYDFYDVDPHFGTMDELKTLVEEAHRRDIKVLFDHIVNHTGYRHPWLSDPDKKDWFHAKKNIVNWNNQDQLEKGWVWGLPDLNQENPDVREYLIDNTLWWIEETGIDGMRLDTMRHVPREFWNEFAKTIKDQYPDFYLMGEVWNNNPRYLELYHEIGIDGLTNYSLFEGIRTAFNEFGDTTTLAKAIKGDENFSDPQLNGIFLDNHDNSRLITEAGSHGETYLKQALTFVLTYPSIPVIYYGTELGMEGGKDPDNRRDMAWEETGDSDVLDFYKKIVKLREDSEAIKDGEFSLLDYDKEFISYMRESDHQRLVFIMNVEDKAKDVVIHLPDSTTDYTDVLSGTSYKGKDSELTLQLKPLDLIILESS